MMNDPAEGVHLKSIVRTDTLYKVAFQKCMKTSCVSIIVQNQANGNNKGFENGCSMWTVLASQGER
jgi:hypothetical protein